MRSEMWIVWMIYHRMVGRPDPCDDPVAKDDIDCIVATAGKQGRDAADEQKQGKPTKGTVGRGGIFADHQVGKDKAASVAGEDVIATELLRLPEADASSESNPPQLVPDVHSGHACIMRLPMFWAIPIRVRLRKYSH